jgi:hypothetical protein
MSPVRYELGFYILEGDILHSHCHENIKSYHTTQFKKNLTQSSEQGCGSKRAILLLLLLLMMMMMMMLMSKLTLHSRLVSYKHDSYFPFSVVDAALMLKREMLLISIKIKKIMEIGQSG